MSITDTKSGIKPSVNISDISETVRVTLVDQDYLKFNQLIPNVVLSKKMADSAKKNFVSKLGIQCFIQIMDKVTLSGKQFVKADVDAILSEYINQASNDETHKVLVKELNRIKPNDEGSVVISASDWEALLAISTVNPK
jgi:hypothetical protein